MIVVGNLEIHQLADNMSSEEFFSFCRANDELRIERERDGKIIIMTPTVSETGMFNADLLIQVGLWNRNNGKIGIIFDSSTGFTLPDGSVRSPDVSFIYNEKWEKLPAKEKQRFAQIVPDFCIELRSKTDSLETLKQKMEMYIENGVRLAWLIDPINQDIFIYRQGESNSVVSSLDGMLSGEDVLPGFELELQELK